MDPTDREAMESRWQANEAELNRLYGLSPLQRETFAKRIDKLETFPPGAPGTVRYSGMR